MLFYNADTGLCVSSVSNAAFVDPTAIVYHPQTNKIISARIADERIYASNVDGSAPAIVYQNSSESHKVLCIGC